jgi:hypothetical protein
VTCGVSAGPKSRALVVIALAVLRERPAAAGCAFWPIGVGAMSTRDTTIPHSTWIRI